MDNGLSDILTGLMAAWPILFVILIVVGFCLFIAPLMIWHYAHVTASKMREHVQKMDCLLYAMKVETQFCPICQKFSPGSKEQCDCGHKFKGGL